MSRKRSGRAEEGASDTEPEELEGSQSQEDYSPPTKRAKKTQQQGESDGDYDEGDGTKDSEEFGFAGADFQIEDEEGELRRVAENHRAAISKIQNAKSEAGIIERVELFNFMCHKRLDVRLGPNTNFIVGHNGSGKSAVLTAITIALGAKATSTNRANSMKSFVKSGESAAEINVTIKNAGPEAYKPEQYGKSITVVRKISKDGAGSWKIKSHDGKTISTKREELDAICDAFSLQVDNPLAVLSQDSARIFLSSSSGEDKYQFFMRGSSLNQLMEEMRALKEHVNQIRFYNHLREETLPDLNQIYIEKTRELSLFHKERQQQAQLEELTEQYIWAQVEEQRKELKSSQKAMADLEKKIAKAKEEQELTEAELEIINETITTLEEDGGKQDDKDKKLQDEEATLQVEWERLQSQKARIDSQIEEVNQAYQGAKRSREDAERRLDAELKKAGKRNNMEELKQQREEVETAIRDVKEQVRDTDVQKEDIQEEIIRLQASLREKEAELSSATQRLGNVDKSITQLNAAKKDSLIAYGNTIPLLVREIEKEKRWKQKPIGPLGTYVQLKDKRWAPLIESVLGRNLNAFLVTSDQDRALLSNIMSRPTIRCSEYVPIIKGFREDFDYRAGEPPSSIQTILRVLQIKDEFVKRQMIIANHIENGVLVERREDAEALLQQNVPNVTTCFSLDSFVRIQTNVTKGGTSTQSLDKHRGPSRLIDDQSATLNGLRHEREVLEDERGRLKHEVDQFKQAVNARNRDIRDLEAKIRHLKSSISEHEGKVTALQEEMSNAQTDPGTSAQFKELIEEFALAAQTAYATFQEKNQELGEIVANIARVQEQRDAVTSQIDERAGKQQNIMHLVAAEAQKRLKFSKARTHWQAQIDKYNAELVQKRSQVEEGNADLQDLIQQAQEETGKESYDGRLDRSPARLEKEMAAIQRQMESRNRMAGNRTFEVVSEEFARAKQNLDEAKEKIDKFMRLVKALEASIDLRAHRWYEWRGIISLRVKALFGLNLDHRNFGGKINIVHAGQGKPGSLDIQVITDPSAHGTGSSKKKEKDPKALSGGEKSFSTICLLLSLWDSIQCPVRCLDEFDVFMDAGNRRISTQMILEASKANPMIQFILISPQSMANAELGETAKVIRMKDPERGQTTLD